MLVYCGSWIAHVTRMCASRMMHLPEADELVRGEEHVQDEAGEGEPLAVEFPKILPHIATACEVYTCCDCCTDGG
jgi:hypothetical protein